MPRGARDYERTASLLCELRDLLLDAFDEHPKTLALQHRAVVGATQGDLADLAVERDVDGPKPIKTMSYFAMVLTN